MVKDEKLRKEVEEPEFEERVVTINRVTKVVKGGRRFRFAALVVIGDKKGRVGFGTGKANEVPDAIKKAVESAKKNIITVATVNTTIPHEVTGVYGAGRVFLAGISDILSKSLGSATPINVIRATVEGLKRLETVEQVAARRGKTVEEIRG